MKIFVELFMQPAKYKKAGSQLPAFFDNVSGWVYLISMADKRLTGQRVMLTGDGSEGLDKDKGGSYRLIFECEKPSFLPVKKHVEIF
ncbi:MAG TPA: hypothetical protein VGD89_05160 [Flavipsychrobacter sp.]